VEPLDAPRVDRLGWIMLTAHDKAGLTATKVSFRQAAKEVDPELLAWYRSLTLRERLRSCSVATRGLARLQRVSSKTG